ncbi:hypothetical protein WMF31_00940 [Sorangium sp. So ce1036]|uniref:hypothetical protein n=1 Tax=Sorangium sp. So ce1036 TaxID=3133328 RepID=UPI003F1229EF
MAELEHDFFLLDRAEHPIAEYRDFAGRPGEIQIHDDLLRYIIDTLEWIPSLNPARKRRGSGLNLYGPMVITNVGAATTRRIFQSWVRLFSCSPPVLRLYGPWSEVVGKAGTGRRLTRRYRRDDVISRLRSLVLLCRRIERGGSKLYLLHMGI